MKTSMLRSLSLIAVTASFVAACGGGGNDQRIPGGRKNFKIAESNIISPSADEVTECLQPSVVIQVSDGLLCNNPGLINDAIFLVQDGSTRQIEFGPAIKTSSSGDTCRIETRPRSWLLPDTGYILSTQIDGSGSVIYDNSDARRFTTGSYADNTACNNAMKIVSRDNSWEENSLLGSDIIDVSSDGDVDINLDDFGPILGALASDFATSFLLNLGGTNPRQVVEIKFNYQPNDRNLTNHILIRRIAFGDLLGIGNIGEEDYSLFETVEFDDCDGMLNCMEVVENVQGQWQIDLSPGNSSWERGYVYFVFVLETLQSVDGRYMNASYVKAVSSGR